MNWKEFLKPDWRKIVLMFIFVMLTSIIKNLGILVRTEIIDYYGFPFPFYGKAGLFEPPQPYRTFFDPIALIGNIIILYLLSCLIVWIYKKVKKK